MGLENIIDSLKEGTKEIAEVAHKKTSEFNKHYLSKVLPDCGKYGDAAKFVAEMAPGVSEYNAISDGDWKGFAIAAGIDIGAFTAGVFTAGAGYVTIKAGSKVAKAGVKKAAKEVAEAGTKQAAKKIVGDGTKKAIREITETGVEKAAKEGIEAGTDKALKEGVEKTTKEVAEKGVKEVSEKVATKVTKEIGEKMDKKLFSKYIKDVEKKTNREIKPKQLEKIKKALKEQEFFKLDPDKSKLHRKLFDNIKDKLIDEWEKNTGDKWPVYAQDVLNEAGEVIRKKGQRLDAHHLIESSFGGPNEWWNLHPAAFPFEHQRGIHATDSLASLIF